MNASGIKGLNYDWYLKILSNFYEPLNECNLKGSINIMSSVNHYKLLKLHYDNLLTYYMTAKIAN